MRIRNFRLKTQRGELLTREHPATNYWLLLQTGPNRVSAFKNLPRVFRGNRGYRR